MATNKKRRKSDDVVVDVNMSPQTLDFMLRQGYIEAQVVWKFTPAGIKVLKNEHKPKRKNSNT